jgi:hypothetical protein
VTDGFDPEPWVAAGFTAEEAKVWHRWRIPPETAVQWRAAGVPDGLRAAQWSTARVTPATVFAWRAAGVDATEAVRCHEMGYDLAAVRELKKKGLTAEQAFGQTMAGPRGLSFTGRGSVTSLGGVWRKLHEAGVPPQVIQGYAVIQWMDEDAIAWAKHHVEATDARLWRDLGLRPVEGGRLARAGRHPFEVIREWWRAGIPYDEVADWLGAGLTAEEAVAQRAKGITIDQARALRALRLGDDGTEDAS